MWGWLVLVQSTSHRYMLAPRGCPTVAVIGSAFRGIKRGQMLKAVGIILITVLAISVVVIVIALLRNYEPDTQPSRSYHPSTHFSTSPSRPGPYYKNCKEAHADGRWNIPKSDPAYRSALDGDGNGIACESPKSRRGAGRSQ